MQHPQPFWHQGLVSWKTIFPRIGVGGGAGGGTLCGFAMNKVHYIYCALYFSSTSYHQALDPGGWRLLG